MQATNLSPHSDSFFSIRSVGESPESAADGLDRAQQCQEWQMQCPLLAVRSYGESQTKQAELRRLLQLEKICVDCQQEIDAERLRVSPTATRCVKCQAEYARHNATFSRTYRRRGH